MNTIHKIYVERVQPAAVAIKRRLTRDNILTIALLAVLFVALIPRAAFAQSFSIDTTSLLTSAAGIFNGLWPAFAIVAGLALGIALVRYIVEEIRRAF